MQDPCRAEAENVLKAWCEAGHEMSSSARLEILCVLACGPQNVSAIAALLELEITVISGHLSKLESKNLVCKEIRGRARLCSLGPRVVEQGESGEVFIRMNVIGVTRVILATTREVVELLGRGKLSIPSTLPAPQQPVTLERASIRELKPGSLSSNSVGGAGSPRPAA